MGNRTLTRQVDAMRSHGIAPERYLLTNVLLASLLGIPLLFVVAYVCARAAATGVFLGTHPGHGAVAFESEFHRLLKTWGPFPGGTQYVLGKLLISALGSASIACHVGLRPKESGAAVAEGVTSAIIRATVFVLVVHMIFAFFEF
jgi:ABC-type transporter Mla maintaining outer membrane lipid asymmetry permease subunit MlaE